MFSTRIWSLRNLSFDFPDRQIYQFWIVDQNCDVGKNLNRVCRITQTSPVVVQSIVLRNKQQILIQVSDLAFFF